MKDADMRHAMRLATQVLNDTPEGECVPYMEYINTITEEPVDATSKEYKAGYAKAVADMNHARKTEFDRIFRACTVKPKPTGAIVPADVEEANRKVKK